MLTTRFALLGAACAAALSAATTPLGRRNARHGHAGPWQRQWPVNMGSRKWPRYIKPGRYGIHHKKKSWPPKPPITNAQCPVKKCRGIHLKQAKGSIDLLETGSQTTELNRGVNYPVPVNVQAEIDGVHEVDEDTGMSVYNVDFKPGHFTCLQCDVGTCADCDIMCDLSMCIGEFYTQECWCRKDQVVRNKKPLWWFREYDAQFMTHESVFQFFCDAKCGGGICDAPGLQCKPREEACKPWWWCNLPPPREDNLSPKDGWPDGFSYTTSMTLAQTDARTTRQKGGAEAEHQKGKGGRARGSLRKSRLQQRSGARLSEQLSEARRAAEAEKARLKAKAKASGPPEFEPNDFGKLNFKSGRFVCESGALPPKIQDPASRLWNDRGYIVFERGACKGSLFVHKCMCWDNVAYLRGEDPMVSEFKCDESCGWGACEGRTCGKGPPPPLPEIPPPPVVDALAAEEAGQGTLHTADNRMDPH